MTAAASAPERTAAIALPGAVSLAPTRSCFTAAPPLPRSE